MDDIDDMRLIYALSRHSGNANGKATVLLRRHSFIHNTTFHNKIPFPVNLFNVNGNCTE